jgi:ubiquinone biosynthesis accessory factor UbiJ
MPFPFLPILEDTANRLLRLDPETLQRLGDLDGRVICVEFRDLGRRIYLHPSESGFRMRETAAQPPAVTLRGSVTVFARLGVGGADAGVAPGDLEIEGDVALGQKMQRILQRLDLDWEEPLARLFGDPLGHALGRGLRAAQAWHVQAFRTLSLDAAEFLREEARLVPTRRELEGFLDAVDTLRADVDRLEARIRRLHLRAPA